MAGRGWCGRVAGVRRGRRELLGSADRGVVGLWSLRRATRWMRRGRAAGVEPAGCRTMCDGEVVRPAHLGLRTGSPGRRVAPLPAGSGPVVVDRRGRSPAATPYAATLGLRPTRPTPGRAGS